MSMEVFRMLQVPTPSFDQDVGLTFPSRFVSSPQRGGRRSARPCRGHRWRAQSTKLASISQSLCLLRHALLPESHKGIGWRKATSPSLEGPFDECSSMLQQLWRGTVLSGGASAAPTRDPTYILDQASLCCQQKLEGWPRQIVTGFRVTGSCMHQRFNPWEHCAGWG